jgi:hypothetical protein
MIRKVLFTILIFIPLLFISAQYTWSQVPKTISYQGILTQSNGAVVSNGNYSITFNLYAESSNGTILWSETQNVGVEKGIFNVILGSKSPIALPFDMQYYLGITVGSGTEMTPRIQLTSSAYSFHSSIADSLNGKSKITSGNIASGQVVKSINNLKDSVTIIAGTNVSITPSGNTLTIASSGGGGTITGITAGTGIDVEGTSGNVTINAAVPFILSGSSSQAIISGTNSNSSSFSSGVYGNGNSGYGVYGYSYSNNGVYGNSSSSTGVYGSSTNWNGVYGINMTNQNIGILGSNSHGVEGYVSGSEQAVFGYNANNSNQGYLGGSSYGAFGGSSNSAGVYGQSTTGWGVYGSSSNWEGVEGRNTTSQNGGVLGGNSYGVEGYSISGFAVYANGSYGGTGINPSVVKLNNSSEALLYSEEAAEVYFTDYGEGTLVNGKIHIQLDPTFLQTVTIDTQHPLMVFLQLEGDCKGAYVTNKTATGFDVIELQGGHSNVSFTYRVVCKRKYFEEERMATVQQAALATQRMMQAVWPEVIEKEKTEQEKMKAAQVEMKH